MPVQFEKVKESENDIRLDRWFKRHYPDVSHGEIEKCLRQKNIRVNQLKATANQRLKVGDLIRVPPFKSNDKTPAPQKALSKADIQFIQSLVIYKDKEVIIINKPAGLAVQGGTKTSRHVDGLLDGLRFDYDERPKLVHRLDKETSGVLMIARSVQAAAKMTKAFKTKDIQKTYWALVGGLPKIQEGKIDAPLIKKMVGGSEKMCVDYEQGERAVSLYHVVDHLSNKISWLEMSPLTGRTHQLRVHCADILKTPIIGDDKYGQRQVSFKNLPKRMYLHAHSLTWVDAKGKEQTIQAPLDKDFKQAFNEYGFEEF